MKRHEEGSLYRNTNWVRRRGARAAAGAGRAQQQARGARSSRRGARAAADAGRARHVGTGRYKGARPGRVAGPASCALGALGLFLTQFDLVLFMSQFLDIVREPGS